MWIGDYEDEQRPFIIQQEILHCETKPPESSIQKKEAFFFGQS